MNQHLSKVITFKGNNDHTQHNRVIVLAYNILFKVLIVRLTSLFMLLTGSKLNFSMPIVFHWSIVLKYSHLHSEKIGPKR